MLATRPATPQRPLNVRLRPRTTYRDAFNPMGGSEGGGDAMQTHGTKESLTVTMLRHQLPRPRHERNRQK
jgi:hypothetical protein